MIISFLDYEYSPLRHFLNFMEPFAAYPMKIIGFSFSNSFFLADVGRQIFVCVLLKDIFWHFHLHFRNKRNQKSFNDTWKLFSGSSEKNLKFSRTNSVVWFWAHRTKLPTQPSLIARILKLIKDKYLYHSVRFSSTSLPFPSWYTSACFQTDLKQFPPTSDSIRLAKNIIFYFFIMYQIRTILF